MPVGMPGVLIERPTEGRPEVGLLGFHPPEPGYRPRPPYAGVSVLGIFLLGKRQVVPGVPATEALGFPALLELLPRILADEFQHPEAQRLFVPRLGHHQRPLDEFGEQVQDLALLDALPGAHLFCRLKCPSPGKHGKSPEECLLVLAKELVAPLERRPQAPMPGLCRPLASAEHLEGSMEPRCELLRRERLHSCGG